MLCLNCGSENAESRKFCGQCGTPLARPCAVCGASNEPGVRFCGECGSPLEAAGVAPAPTPFAEPVSERRRVTVLFADLVGFTLPPESRDPAEVRELRP